jgi:hypothetical protein
MNKLHDGAVIIRDLRIAKAGVFFPFTTGRVIDESFGSRHRAALGITDETDAVLVVVSEERGSISFCFNGNIVSDLDGPRLRAALEGVFSPKSSNKQGTPSRIWQLVPETLRKPRLPFWRPSATPKVERASEAPPASVRIRATPPPGASAPTSGESPSTPSANTKPLRKAATKAAAEPAKSSPGSREASSVPPASDEST